MRSIQFYHLRLIVMCVVRDDNDFLFEVGIFFVLLTISFTEYLTFVVRLRLSKFSKSKQDNQIENLLKLMGLTDCQNQAGFPSAQKAICLID